MNNKEIIDNALRIVRYRLEDMEDAGFDSIVMTKSELLQVSTALLLATVLRRANDAND